MTLTALVPDRSDGTPAPLDPGCWPEDARATCDDVVVSGGSVLRTARAAGLPFTWCSSELGIAVGQVFARTDGVAGRTDLVLDIPDALDYCWFEARLIGRVSEAHVGTMRLSTPARWQAAASALPRDVGPGDLVAVPFVRR